MLGYASSAFLGTIVASLGDRYGHKVNCVLYGFAYAFVCVVSSRRSDVFSLYFARVLGGICYSLLFSSFEAWAIAECDRKKIHRRNLARLFASATFFNALSAVVAGIIGNAVVDTFSRKNGYYTGSQSRTLPRLQTADEARVERPLPELRIKTSLFVTEKEPNEFAPAFDVAAGALFLCGCLCASLWVNNKTKVNREDEENDEGDENAAASADANARGASSRSPLPGVSGSSFGTSLPGGSSFVRDAEAHLAIEVKKAWFGLRDDASPSASPSSRLADSNAEGPARRGGRVSPRA